VWFGFILAASLRGLAAAADDPRQADSGPGGPIDLAASTAIVWDAPDGRWVVLSGEASAAQGGRGVTASALVVRITQQALGDATVFQAELYAEGQVRAPTADAAPRKEGRAVLQTVKDVRIASKVSRLDAAPKGLDLVDRAGFPAQAPAVVAPPGPLPREVVDQAGLPVGPQTAARPRPADLQVVEAQALVPADDAPGLAPAAAPAQDPEVRPAQDGGRPAPRVEAEDAPVIDLPPIELEPEEGFQVPDLRGGYDPAPTPTPELEPLPGAMEDEPAPPIRADEPHPPAPEDDPLAPPPAFTPPTNPGSQRVTWIYPRSGRPMDVKEFRSEDGTSTIIVRGGVNVVSTNPQFGTVDIEAESAVIWRHPDTKKGEAVIGSQGERIEDPAQPMEIYLEGNVILRQDENKFAGKADQKTFRADKIYYDFVTDKLMAVQAQADVFAPNLISPMKLKAPRIEQFRAVVRRDDGTLVLSPDPEIRAERAISTGSRFPDPAYKIYNRSITLNRTTTEATDPVNGKPLRGPNGGPTTRDSVWRYDARTNLFYMGPVPIFYWPRFTGETDDLDPPLRMISFRTNNYFGQQLLTDWNGFKVFGIRRPNQIDNWNLDIDYLSARTKTFPALGSELGWFGSDLVNDVLDPYHRDRNREPSFARDYFGYFDAWGLQDKGIDVLGSGPAIVTNGPPGAGSRGYQRSGVPPFQDIRGRFNIRHMQRFLPDDEDHKYEDLRLQAEVSYSSDRYFLEEYYKRLFDIGMDQETLLYGQYQKDHWSASLWAEANLMDFNTESQWLPRFDYYRLGDTLFGNRLVHYQHSGVNYANTHTDIMVNNPNLFAYMPTDPISNTSGVFEAGRAYTNHELSLPLNLADVVRINPYVQGQAMGWTDQIGGGPNRQQSVGALGRIWGAAGVRAETTIWKVYSGVENEILNIHGLNNKVSFFGDYRTSYSNVRLNDIAIQDDLDDNSYEHVRRYFAITSWQDGVLPQPYDPRHLILRRAYSPITGPADVLASMDTFNFGIHQRLQTKRGPEGRRRIVDWMTLDASTTLFPYAERDNFGKPWGQTMYNYQWFLGDRTSIISSGMFDYWNLVGSEPLDNYNVPGFNPKGLNFITTGISLSRPPRGSVYIGYSVVNTGPIQTSALNTSINYWLSPKWYGTYSTSYDFGNKISLGSMFSFTRIGADYLLSLGLSVDPQRQSYMFAFQISPRLAPMLRLGSGVGLNQFDSRLAPVQ